MNCLLCQSDSVSLLLHDAQFKVGPRDYYHCSSCDLIFVSPQQHLSFGAQKGIYDHHENHPEDKGYQRFISTLIDPLKLHLKKGDTGLDFGCGEGPVTPVLLKDQRLSLYDPIYRPDENVFTKQWDFIVLTEVLEHLSHPIAVFEKLVGVLNPGGFLAVMTSLRVHLDHFENWFYRCDPTHICFYHQETLLWITNKFEFQIMDQGANWVIWQKAL